MKSTHSTPRPPCPSTLPVRLLTLAIVFSAVRWVSLFGTVMSRDIKWSTSRNRFRTHIEQSADKFQTLIFAKMLNKYLIPVHRTYPKKSLHVHVPHHNTCTIQYMYHITTHVPHHNPCATSQYMCHITIHVLHHNTCATSQYMCHITIHVPHHNTCATSQYMCRITTHLPHQTYMSHHNTCTTSQFNSSEPWIKSSIKTSDVLEHKWRASLKLHYC